MDIFSIIFLVIILFFTIFGLIKGFLKTILIFFRGIISYLLAIALCSPVASLLFQIPFIKSWESGMISWLNNQNALFSTVIYPNQKEIIIESLKLISIPQFLASMIADKISPNIPVEGIIISETVSYQLIHMVLLAVAFILILITSRFLLFFLRKILTKAIESVSSLKAANRVFGTLLGLVIGLVIIYTTCFILSVITTIPLFNGLASFMVSEMKIGTNEFTLSKFLYEHNLLLYIIMNL